MPGTRETLDPGPSAGRTAGARPRREPLLDDQRLWVGLVVLGLLLILAVVLQALRV